MKPVSINQPLTDAEFDRLSDFLDKAGTSGMNIESTDGFLAALICGPDLVSPSEYLPHIWGEDYTFETTKKASDITMLLMRHWNTISNALQRTLKVPDVYLPVLLEDKDGVAHGNDWAIGFMRGVKIHPKSWNAIFETEENTAKMIPFMAFAHEHDPDPLLRPESWTPKKREELLVTMAASLTWVYRFFEPYRQAGVSNSKAQNRLPYRELPPMQRRAHKIGRNEPCYCGSGKKFKFCCDGKEQFLQ